MSFEYVSACCCICKKNLRLLFAVGDYYALNIFSSHRHTTSAHPTLAPCIAAKLLSPQTYYPTRQIAIFNQNSAVCPMLANRTVKPPIPIYSAFLDITTTHSTWHEPLQTMSAVVLRFDGTLAFVGAYRGICPSRR